MANTVTLTGRMGQDPEMRQTQAGIDVANFSLAVSVYKKGEEPGVMWIPVVVFGDQAGRVCDWGRKGREVVVNGRLSQREWTDSNSQTNRVVTEVISQTVDFFGEHNPAGTAAAPTRQRGKGKPQGQPQRERVPF